MRDDCCVFMSICRAYKCSVLGPSDAGQILISHFLEGSIGVAASGAILPICRDPRCAEHLPKVKRIAHEIS
jgi:hypothetical protein